MKKRKRLALSVGTLFLTVLTGVLACTTALESGSTEVAISTSPWPSLGTYEVPDNVRSATMVWSAEPGIDLFSTEGTLTRAALESFSIGLMVGLDYTYRGFETSLNGPGGRLSRGFDFDTERGPYVGTVRARIQQIWPSDSGFDVLSCVLSVGLDVREGEKYFPSRLVNGEGIEMRSRFTRTGEPAMGPTVGRWPSEPMSKDPNWQAPIGNEFLGWEIDGLADVDPLTSGNGRCVPWARSLYPDTTPIIARDAYVNDHPPPVQPAYPGWPQIRY